MNISYEALNILVFLLPGFLSTIIYNAIIIRTDKESLSKLFEVLVYVFLIYSTLYLFFGESPCFLSKQVEGQTVKYVFSIEKKYLFGTLCLSIVFPVIFGVINSKNWFGRLLTFLNITNKTSRESAWQDIFSDVKKCIIITLKSGSQIYGWPLYYSNDCKDGLIFLDKPKWVNGSTYIEMNIPGILIFASEISHIQFINYPPTNKRSNACQTLKETVVQKEPELVK